MSVEMALDPRVRLVREKYFSLRPRPLERWLWSRRVPPAAERVFWLHWQEGLQRGDWCSEVPLRRVARECCIDLSTVTKAYQLLARIGCLRRTDPGRDPANPFQQAVAVTEVRVPAELVAELGRHPSRRTHSGQEFTKCVRETPADVADDPTPTSVARIQDPLAGLRGRERRQALTQLTGLMSVAEQSRYHEAVRTLAPQMLFDPGSKVPPEDQGRVGQLLAIMATAAAPVIANPPTTALTTTPRGPRKLSAFDLARLRRAIQTATGTCATELLHQVLWSIEEGALHRFGIQHAIHIAVKKIREGAWTRPNRFPPNWTRPMGPGSVLETCRYA